MHHTGTAFPTDYRGITVRLVDGTILDGRINIQPHKRLSDFVNSKDKGFVIMIEGSSIDIKEKTVFINKREISWVEPKE